MDKQQFIQSLSRDLKSTPILRNIYLEAFIFLSTIIVPLVLLVIVVGMREDISFYDLKINYVVEGVILLLLFFAILFASMKSREPGVTYDFEKTSAVVLFIIWIMSSEYWGHEGQLVDLGEPEYSCAGLVLISSLVFGSLLYYFVRRGYLISPMKSLFMSVFSGAMLGAIMLHLVCLGDTSSHLLFWHIIPVIIWPCVVCGGWKLFRGVFFR